MDSPLVPVFIAVIAIVAVMQAVFVAGLAVALRVANARMADLQEALDREITKPVADMARMAEIAVRTSEQALFHAQRLEGIVEDASTRIESVVGEVTRKLTGAGADFDQTEEEVEEEILEPVRDQLSGVAALFRGVQRAVEVWRETR